MLLTNLAAMTLHVILLACCVSQKGAREQDPLRTPDQSRAALDAWLARFPNIPRTKDEGLTIEAVDDEAVRRVFVGEQFYGVHFYVNYPRPKTLPEGLRTHNLIVVQPGGAVERVGDREALQTLFEKKVSKAGDDARARDTTIACLRVAEEFYQDGLYAFHDPAVKVTRQGDELVATGEAQVKSRGTGKVVVTLTFKLGGEVDKVKIEGRVRPDVRRR